MTWMKYPVLAATITAAGWGFIVAYPTPSFAVSDAPAAQAIASHDSKIPHFDHEDHIDPEPDEIKETFYSKSYTVLFPHPVVLLTDAKMAHITGFNEAPERDSAFGMEAGVAA